MLLVYYHEHVVLEASLKYSVGACTFFRIFDTGNQFTRAELIEIIGGPSENHTPATMTDRPYHIKYTS